VKIEEMERLATALTARLMGDPHGALLPMAVRAWKECYQRVLREFIDCEIAEREEARAAEDDRKNGVQDEEVR
jgi:hypothetical protein